MGTADADYMLSGVQAFHIGNAQAFMKYEHRVAEADDRPRQQRRDGQPERGTAAEHRADRDRGPVGQRQPLPGQGSAGTDNISIGDVNTPLAVTGGSLRATLNWTASSGCGSAATPGPTSS